MKRKGLNRPTFFDVILAVLLILFCATVILPFVHLLAVSFSGKGVLIRGEVSLWPKDFTFGNYIRLFTDRKLFDFPRWFGNTMLVAGCSCA